MSTVLDGFTIRFERDGGTVVVRVAGDVDVATAPQLEQGFASLIGEQGNLSIRVDLAAVTFIDSTGLTALVRALRDVRQRGGNLVLANPSPRIRRVLDMVGLSQVLSIRPGATMPGNGLYHPSVAGR